MLIKLLEKQGEIEEALSLVWNVFLEFEAPEYCKQGINTFETFIKNKEAISILTFYGAFCNKQLAGVIAIRDKSHISLFFVKKQYHKKGIGKALFSEAAKSCGSEKITVNSSPYAVSIYKKLGFLITNKEQVVDGIRFIPMIFNLAYEKSY